MSEGILQGDLESFSIFDVAQSLLMGRKTAKVLVQSGSKRGVLFFHEGQITYALDENLGVGEGAAMVIFSWHRGSFSIDFSAAAPEPNITMPTDSLLLEVARNIDEIQREQGVDARDPTRARADEDRLEGGVRHRNSEKLRIELKSLFQEVASAAEPVRPRHTVNAFDASLNALLDLQGSALFLRPGEPPRIRTPKGFESIRDDVITEDDVAGFLRNALSQAETAELRERKELATFFRSAELGSFRVTAVNESGGHLLSFTPVEHHVSALEAAMGGAPQADQVRRLTQGLIVVGGPMGSGKSSLMAAVVQAHMESSGAFGILFCTGARHNFSTERGFVIQREMPAPGRPLHEALRLSLEQDPDIVALGECLDAETLRLAASVASSQRLVIVGVESHSREDTGSLLARFARQNGHESLGQELARSLRAVVYRPALRPGTPQPPEIEIVDETRALQLLEVAPRSPSPLSPSPVA